MFIRATNTPFKKPHAVPTTKQSKTATQIENCAVERAHAMTIPDNVITAPTDRSIPPVILTTMTPIAKVIRIEPWRRIFMMLLHVLKIGSDQEK